jgi:hypothetical protein
MSLSVLRAGMATLVLAALGVATPCTAYAQITLTSELVRIGTADGEVTWSGSARTMLDEIGNIYALKTQENQVWVFDSTGQRVRRFGRAGAGPGDFRLMGWGGFHGDNLWVSDARLRRITILSRDGEVVRTIPFTHFRTPPGVRAGPIHAVLGDGTLLMIPDMSQQVVADRTVPVMRFDQTGQYLGAVFSLLREPSQGMIQLEGTRAFFYSQPFASPGVFRVASDGSYYVGIASRGSGRDRELILQVGWTGDDRLLEVPLPMLPRVSLSPATVQEIRGRYTSLFQERAGFPRAEAARLARDSIRFPDGMAMVPRLVAGADGIVWILPDLAGQEGDTVRWFAFDTRSRRFSSIELPANVSITDSRGGRLVVAERGEYDVTQIVVYRYTATWQ